MKALRLGLKSITSRAEAGIWHLPAVKTSIYFYRTNEEEQQEKDKVDNKDVEEVEQQQDQQQQQNQQQQQQDQQQQQQEVEQKVERSSLSSTVKLILSEAKLAYSSTYVIKWSVWVAASTCLNFQVKKKTLLIKQNNIVLLNFN